MRCRKTYVLNNFSSYFISWKICVFIIISLNSIKICSWINGLEEFRLKFHINIAFFVRYFTFSITSWIILLIHKNVQKSPSYYFWKFLAKIKNCMLSYKLLKGLDLYVFIYRLIQSLGYRNSKSINPCHIINWYFNEYVTRQMLYLDPSN